MATDDTDGHGFLTAGCGILEYGYAEVDESGFGLCDCDAVR